MTTKADFNAEEWERVLQGPAIAGLIVVAVQRGGTIRETVEMAKVYKEAREQHAGSDLLGEIVSSPPTADPRRFESVEQLRSRGRGADPRRRRAPREQGIARGRRGIQALRAHGRRARRRADKVG